MSQKVKLTEDQVKEILLQSYDLHVDSVTSVRGIVQVTTDKGRFSFKNAVELPDLPFIRDCLQEIRHNGFPYTPTLVMTRDNESQVTYEGERYYLDQWIDGHELSKTIRYEQPLGKALARFHRASKAMRFPKDSARHRYGIRAGFLLKCRDELHKWRRRGAFAHKYDRQALEFLSDRCRLAYSYIERIHVDQHRVLAAICHGSLHHENIIIDSAGRIWFIDFESLVYAERVLDLAQLIHYYAYPHDWQPEVVTALVNSYEEQYEVPLSTEEHQYFLSYLAFPRRLYNAMVQYFEERPTSTQQYLKLKKVIEIEWLKERFLQRFGSSAIAVHSPQPEADRSSHNDRHRG